MSASTRLGWWKVPIRFLPCLVSMPVLPPIEEIDLGEEGGRHLHDADASPQDARGEAGQISHHAAAEGDDAVAALDAELEQLLAQPIQHGKALARFARCHDHLAEQEPLRNRGSP